jgi:hypothetical protein
MAQWRGLVTLTCLGLLAALAGVGGLSEGFGTRRAWAQEELFVANQFGDSITVYARTADGDTAPRRTLTGASTRLNFPMGVVVDTVHDELVVANGSGNSITVYARTASGDTAPLRILGGANTGLDRPVGPLCL